MRPAARIAAVAVLGLVLVPPAPAADTAGQGFLYGTVDTQGGHRYTGLLRWGTEEAFWDDLFNSTKGDLPYLERHGSKEHRRKRITIFGITVGYRYDDGDSSRMFIARFGDIESIEVLRGERIRVTMKGGEAYTMEGGSNDVGAEIAVRDEALGDVKLKWDRIERITFKAPPAGVKPEAKRLFGKLETEDGSFEGYVQWDTQECLSVDKLDGETEDGDLSLDMGQIRSLEKRNQRGMRVVLKDGRELVLENTNDVDSSLRGVWIEDPRYGRVQASWDAFERLELEEVATSGRAYGEYGPAKALRGKVTDDEGAKRTGTIVFDLDERYDWEILNGKEDDIDYYVPFRLIRSIEPQRSNASRVVLRSGAELVLNEGHDVSEDNSGVVVLGDDGAESYTPWSRVQRIDFD